MLFLSSSMALDAMLDWGRRVHARQREIRRVAQLFRRL
jgi:hypothetical protein